MHELLRPIRNSPTWLHRATRVCGVVVLTTAMCQAGEPDGLIGRWKFDEVQGRLAMDASGHANHAVVSNGLLVKGVNRRGLQFDGQTTQATCPHSPSLGVDRSLSIEAWFRLHARLGNDYATIVRKDNSFALRFSGERLGFLRWQDGNVVSLAANKTEWETDRWYHVAATFDGRHMRLYIDGREEGHSSSAADMCIDVTDQPLGIGSCGGRYPLHGIIDDVCLYNRAISSEAVLASYKSGVQCIEQQHDHVIAPQRVGQFWSEFRKPRREIRAVGPGFLWIDAEDFGDYGGWLLDTQFVHLMGSAYLIAAGVGTPVEDATVDVEIPQAGNYRLWVRAKNWIKDHSPGRFQVRVGETASRVVFGASDTEDWIWQSGGEFDLAAGRQRITLHDLTGYYGRCDALILTTDLDYRPPDEPAAIARQRSRLTGLSLKLRSAGDFDVVVVGAGAAGSCAALASARMGAKTALIQNRPVLGGNASVELGVGISGASCCHRNARESGIIEEVGRIRARYGFPRMSQPFQMAAEAEPNLSVFLNQHVDGVTMGRPGTIESVRAVDALTGEIAVYRGRVFLDCTGDGWVGYYADADFRFGREARDEFNESLAPEQPDRITMSGCLMGRLAVSYRATHAGEPRQYVPPAWAAKLPPADRFGRTPRGFTSGEWWIEHPGTIDDLWDAEKARDELIRISFGYWDFIKNHWPGREQAASYALTWVPITDAKRESRRLVGDYILSQNDVQNAAVFPDRISYGGWPLDVHHPEGIFSGEKGPFDFNPRVPIYTIPYRCLYSQNVDNLLFAGRNMSVTHVALGTVRVQGTLATLGQAAGTAAAMCLKYDVSPRDLGLDHLTELQQTLLKHDQYIPGVRNEDPGDLARRAKVSASSTAGYEPFGLKQAQRSDEIHPLNMARAVMVPRGLKRNWNSISLLLSSELDEPQEVTLHVCQASAAGDYASGEEVATITAAVPPGREAWVKFPVHRELGASVVYVWLPATDGISWRLMSRAPVGASRAYGGGNGRTWTIVPNQYYAIAVDPPFAIPADYACENVINGVARIEGNVTNLWASDPEQTMPQWIELTLPASSRFDTVYLTFDTDMNERAHTTPLVPQCVRDYELACLHGDRWVTLTRQRGNFQRRRVHRFPPVEADRLRLTIHATNGAPSARVFEIRVYHESAE